jgi:hypothetical protein
LATGEGDKQPFFHLPTANDIGESEKALFSKVFDARLASVLAPKYESPYLQAMVDLEDPDKETTGYRESLAAGFSNVVSYWLDELSDDSIEKFDESLRKAGWEVFQGFPKDKWEQIFKRRRHARMAKAAKEAWSEQSQEMLLNPEKYLSKLTVDVLADSITIPDMSSENGYWTALVDRLKLLTSAKGAKAQLARDLKTSRQAVNKWFSGKGAPSAELTLRLLYWVSESEVKQIKNAGSVSAQPARKTRARKSSSHEKQSPDPKKR